MQIKVTFLLILLSFFQFNTSGQENDSIAWDKVFYSISKSRHIVETPDIGLDHPLLCNYNYVFDITDVKTILSRSDFTEDKIALVYQEDLFFCNITTYNDVVSVNIDVDRIRIVIYVIVDRVIAKKLLFTIKRKNYKAKQKKIKG